mmetsp:Transcript_10817/g.17844  ORF Transcript_10817/g.17844 Transcript_10817/m.17844 type:complete len:727 (-) Transcript_10817:219-2399(-)
MMVRRYCASLCHVVLLLLFLTSAEICSAVSAAVDEDDDFVHQMLTMRRAFIDRLPPNVLAYFKSSEHAFASGNEVVIINSLNDLEARIGSPGTSPQDRIGYLRVLALYQPGHLHTLLRLGDSLTAINPSEAMHYYEKSFDSAIVGEGKTVVEQYPHIAFVVANLLGRYFMNEQNNQKGIKYAKMAFEISKQGIIPPTMGGNEGDTCSLLTLATSMDTFPASLEAADASIRTMNYYADIYLNHRETTVFDDQLTTQTLPVSMSDPYIHCALTLFPLSFYYREDVAAIASQHYNIVTRAWPKLKEYVAPHILEMNRGDGSCHEDSPDDEPKRINLAVVSGALSSGHFVSEDFGGVLSRLSRELFKVTYVFVHEGVDLPIDPIFEVQTKENGGDDEIIHLYMNDEIDTGNGAWPVRLAEEMGKLRFDIALFLDLTMSRVTRRMAMSRFAPVQLNTHGHPITSGIRTVQYYVSWAEAELPVHQAQAHYSEKLLLIPQGKMHQYYQRRIIDESVSRLSGGSIEGYTLESFGLPSSYTGAVYLNMQKPFKIHPEFDELLCGILNLDTTGIAVLHKADTMDTHQIFLDRLESAKCPLSRVYFVEAQPHHSLIALYKLCTIVLDSYPAGGCTTSREVLEVGKAIVTLPARLLGGRWTVAYYNIMELDHGIQRKLVASSTAEYIEYAVQLGTNSTLIREVETEIALKFPNLLSREDAVDEWQKLLLQTHRDALLT